jgi:hypothetical protein
VILGPSLPHAGKAAAKSAATDAVIQGLTRCRAAQRRFRNTLFFVAADEALLSTARDAMRKAMAWKEICEDKRVQSQLTNAQSDDAKEKARTSRDGAAKAVRLAWSHIRPGAAALGALGWQPGGTFGAHVAERRRVPVRARHAWRLASTRAASGW